MLNPELISKKLIGKTFIRKVFFFDETGSTNLFAKSNNLPDNSIVITNHQANGKGRFERVWKSDRGVNLTFTLVKKINIKNKEQVYIIYWIAFSIFTVLKKIIPANLKNVIEIKWPNDILINGKKIAGILIESRPRTKNFIIGIGINVNQHSFSKELIKTATSLKIIVNNETNLNLLLVKLIKEIDKNLQFISGNQLDKIYNLWKKQLKIIGRKVTFIAPNGEKITGIVKNIPKTGGIQIYTEKGNLSFNSGEIKQLEK